MVRDSAMVTIESLWETTIALSNGTIADPLRPPLPPKWGPKYTLQDQLCDEYDRRYRQGCCVPCWMSL